MATLPELVDRFMKDVSFRASLLDQSQSTRKAAVEATRAALENARINLSYTPIKAPISGRIGKSNVTVGALATAYQATPLAMIQQLNPVYVDVVQSNADLLRLRASLESGRLQRDGAHQRKVKLILEDGSTYPAEGTLQFRDFSVDTTTGAVTLRMVFPNTKEVLLPGMFVRAVVEDGVRNQAILVQQQAISRDGKGLPYAWVVGKDGKVERRAIELERAVGNRWLVTKGLAESDRLIVEGGDRVRAGATVRVVPFTDAQGSTPAPGTSPDANQKAGGHV
jgi:membrane fusion protein (multidrug efflux system)